MSRPTCCLPSCRRPAAFAASHETGTVVLCRHHRARLVVELAKRADVTARRLAADLTDGAEVALSMSGMPDIPAPTNARQASALAGVPEGRAAAELPQSPIGDSESPANEAQARALAAVPEGAGA